MFSVLGKVIPILAPSGVPTIRLKGLLHKQQIQLCEVQHMNVIPMGLSLVDHQPLPALQRPLRKLRDLPGHALSGAGAETVDAAGTDNRCLDAFGKAVEDNLVDVAVPGLVRKVGHFLHMVKVVVNLGGELLAVAIGFPIEED